MKAERVIFLPGKKLLAAISSGSAVSVYDLWRPRKAPTMFQAHSAGVRDVAGLEQDLLVSVGGAGKLFSWRPSTGDLVGQWAHSAGESLDSVMKVDARKVLIEDCSVNLIVLTH